MSDRGDVELLGVFGDDLTVVNCARVSFGKWKDEMDASDERLVQFLVREKHWTPFAHPQMRFRFRMPIAIAAQWYKHQVGLVVNSVSRRYVDSTPEVFIPKSFRAAPENRRDGSGKPLENAESERLKGVYGQAVDYAVSVYRELLASGVCPEQARFVLPQGMFTEFIQTGSLAAFTRIVKQRTHGHAQKEIRFYAARVEEAIRWAFPLCGACLLPNRMGKIEI